MPFPGYNNLLHHVSNTHLFHFHRVNKKELSIWKHFLDLDNDTYFDFEIFEG